MIYETVILPGEGLGNLVKLGDSMYTIIKYLTKFDYKLKISYSDSEFLDVPIVVSVVDFGIRLTFRNKKDQTLDLVELLDLSSSGQGSSDQSRKRHKLMKILYKGISLNEFENHDIPPLSGSVRVPLELGSKNSSTSSISEAGSSNSSTTLTSSDPRLVVVSNITLKSIYNKIFGPTYPGKLNPEFSTYILSYPGVSFKFKILNEELYSQSKKSGSGAESDPNYDESILSTLLNWDTPEDVVCDSIALYKGNSWDEFDFRGSATSLNAAPATTEKNASANTAGHKSKNDISLLKIDLSNGIINIRLKHSTNKEEENRETPILKIGKTTQQEVLNILGPPDDYFNKSDSRLLIHNHLPFIKHGSGDDTNGKSAYKASYQETLADQDISHYKFHNYFRYGIDILYDLNNSDNIRDQNTSSTTIKKIIIHNGGITESLNFMKWNRCNWEIEATLDSGESITFNSSMCLSDLPQQIRQLTPVLLNRNESEFIDNDLDIIELPQESSHDSARSSQKVKTWGQSKLYGFDRCIFEVVDSNGCISSVTVY